jgi:hypothetical protein
MKKRLGSAAGAARDGATRGHDDLLRGLLRLGKLETY